MTLYHDTTRCTGGSDADPCPERETCRRYTERATGGRWTPHADLYQPGDLLGCEHKKPVEDKA